AASCVGPLPTRLLITCTGPGNDARNSGENVGSCCGRTGVSGVGGVGVGVGASGGTGGGGAFVGSVTMLLGPVLVTTPVPVELVIVPELAPAKPPTVLLAPLLLTAPEAVEAVMTPALAAANPPTVLLA